MSGNQQDVGGVWYGRWDAEQPQVAPNRFIAMLEEQGGAITGTISEPDADGGEGVLRALVRGERSGSSIAWVKQYDASGRLAHAVRYAGAVNADATEIRGRWHLKGLSGGFAMIREKFSEAELETEEELLLPL
ncbi:hypothetical protein [Sphingomonas xinjiangensis]|uniref:Uncharacterized protein n=1 Tax=Sphingomonas xinjiangensis TaxID=643568 RepID=A0A840Y9J2_9SPHN|nr:hypothetical protein [Sphingomonas xinjiangensis]MBB5708965.1 hypothetical protein [Sphingomonas xinjiangensis]